MKNSELREMSVKEMVETTGGCGACRLVDAVAAAAKFLIHALR